MMDKWKSILFGVFTNVFDRASSLLPKQRFLRFIMNRLIKSYLLNPIQRDEFDSQFNHEGNTKIQLYKVVLDSNVLNDKLGKDSKFRFGVVSIDSIVIEIPWLSITTDSIKIKVKGVEVNIYSVNIQDELQVQQQLQQQYGSGINGGGSSRQGSLIFNDEELEGDEVTVNSLRTISDSIIHGVTTDANNNISNPLTASSVDMDNLSQSLNNLMSMNGGAKINSLRPEDNVEVMAGLHQQLVEILHNVQVELENISIYISPSKSNSSSTLELNILNALFNYQMEEIKKENVKQQESTTTTTNNNNNIEKEEEKENDEEEEVKEKTETIYKPRFEFDQLSVMIHNNNKFQQSGQQPNNQSRYIFATEKSENVNQHNVILFSDNLQTVDIEFSSVIRGNIGMEQVTNLLDLLNTISNNIKQFQQEDILLNTSSSSLHDINNNNTSNNNINGLSNNNNQQQSFKLNITIPTIYYIINLPIIEGNQGLVKPNFKIHLIGKECRITQTHHIQENDEESEDDEDSDYQRRYTTSTIEFDELSIDLLPDGKKATMYRCLNIQQDYDRKLKPTIKIIQKQQGCIIDKSNIFLNQQQQQQVEMEEELQPNNNGKGKLNNFLVYKSPKELQVGREIDQYSNSLSTMIIECILPEFNLSIYKSDYQELRNAFFIQSDQPQTSTFIFNFIAITGNIEFKFDDLQQLQKVSTVGGMDEMVKSFNIMIEEFYMYSVFGLPHFNSLDGMFVNISLNSLDTIAIFLNNDNRLFFTSKTNLDGLELSTTQQRILISNSYELSVGPICFVPSIHLINNFLNWIYLSESTSPTTTTNNSPRNSTNTNSTPPNTPKSQEEKVTTTNVELFKCKLQFNSNNNQFLNISYDKLSILISPEGVKDDLFLIIQPLNMFIKDETMTSLQQVGNTTKKLVILLKQSKIEILSNQYEFTFYKNTFNLFNQLISLFFKKISTYLMLTNNNKEISDTLVEFVEIKDSQSSNNNNNNQNQQNSQHNNNSNNQNNNNGDGKNILNLINMMEDYDSNQRENDQDFEHIKEDDLMDEFEMIDKPLEVTYTIVIVGLNVTCVFYEANGDNIKLDCQISEILYQNFEMGPNTKYDTSVKLNIQNLFIYDNIVNSPYRNLFGPLSYYKQQKKKQTFDPNTTSGRAHYIKEDNQQQQQENLLSLILYSRKDHFDRTFYNIKLLIDPLFIQAYQLTIEFLLEFFSLNQQHPSNPQQSPSNNQQQQESPRQQDLIIFDEIEIFPLKVRIDYKPKRGSSGDYNQEDTHYTSIRYGGYVWMFAGIQLNEASFTLPLVHIIDTPSSKLMEKILGTYQPNLIATNVLQYMGGVAPVRILFNLGSGVSALIRKPIEEAKGSKNAEQVVKGVGKGVGKGIQTLTVELLTVGTKVVGSASNMLKHLDPQNHHQLPNNNNNNQNIVVGQSPHQINSSQSIWMDQPESIRQGTEKAMKQVIGGFHNAIFNIVSKPFQNYQSNGTVGFISALVYGVPGLVISPVSGITDGIISFSLGLRNTLDSSRILKDYKKYKHPTNNI